MCIFFIPHSAFFGRFCHILAPQKSLNENAQKTHLHKIRPETLQSFGFNNLRKEQPNYGLTSQLVFILFYEVN